MVHSRDFGSDRPLTVAYKKFILGVQYEKQTLYYR